ncbi:F-box protein PP2-A11-like [Olea europaea var. sylvestris]|uniref:F-box protein PP2-A11-like n=1 Tax=Olea europaea var. sylvestris TaxID=158386 RepID=UPI000C1D41B3|nr:F-box protein PP2-A11-like [Olea europaea var. sylvestris]
MGGGFSALANEKNIVTHPSNPNLGDLPESCIALILSCLEPSEICKLARLNKTFHQSSFADVVWESKLPENHQILVKKLFSVEESSERLSKKEIFSRLCRPIRFSGDTKEVWLEKGRRGICVAISWKGMKITGIDDRRYWTHISTDESRFHTIAYLQQMWWLEVEGNLEFEFPAGNYSLFFRLQIGRTSKRAGWRIVSDLEQVHGWNIKPVKFQLELSNGQHTTSNCYLNEAAGKWMHYHVGDFVVENSYIPTKLKFSMAQIDCTHTKAGLCLDSVFIFPSESMKQLKQF